MQREELINEIVNAYGTTARLLKSYVHEVMGGEAVGPSQLHLLLSIASWQPAPTQKQLAEYMHITPGALTQLIEPLVEAGYVTRQADTADRRRMHLKLSATGKSTLHTLKLEHAKLFASLLQSLTDDELAVMLKAQQKMFSALEVHYKKERP